MNEDDIKALVDQVYARMDEQLTERMQQASNALKPFLLEGEALFSATRIQGMRDTIRSKADAEVRRALSALTLPVALKALGLPA